MPDSGQTDFDSETVFDSVFPTDFWSILSTDVASGAVVDQPFNEIAISSREHDTGTQLAGVVTHPIPDLPDEELNAENASKREENKPVALSNTVALDIERVIASLRSCLSLKEPETGSISDSFVRLLLQENSVAAVYRVRKEIPAEADLHSQFQELMVTLGYGDDPSKITHGSGLHPETQMSATSNGHDVDFGMAATAYRLVPDPHSYWSDCETLDDFIEKCVENGADRDDLMDRDEYFHHFHPQTDYQTLTGEQEDALIEWEKSIEKHIADLISVDGPLIDRSVSDVTINRDGSAIIEVSISIGDEISRL